MPFGSAKHDISRWAPLFGRFANVIRQLEPSVQELGPRRREMIQPLATACLENLRYLDILAHANPFDTMYSFDPAVSHFPMSVAAFKTWRDRLHSEASIFPYALFNALEPIAQSLWDDYIMNQFGSLAEVEFGSYTSAYVDRIYALSSKLPYFDRVIMHDD